MKQYIVSKLPKYKSIEKSSNKKNKNKKSSNSSSSSSSSCAPSIDVFGSTSFSNINLRIMLPLSVTVIRFIWGSLILSFDIKVLKSLIILIETVEYIMRLKLSKCMFRLFKCSPDIYLFKWHIRGGITSSKVSSTQPQYLMWATPVEIEALDFVKLIWIEALTDLH